MFHLNLENALQLIDIRKMVTPFSSLAVLYFATKMKVKRNAR
jgi:hypothetical protein